MTKKSLSIVKLDHFFNTKRGRLVRMGVGWGGVGGQTAWRVKLRASEKPFRKVLNQGTLTTWVQLWLGVSYFFSFYMAVSTMLGFPGGADSKESSCNARDGFDPWVRKIP